MNRSIGSQRKHSGNAPLVAPIVSHVVPSPYALRQRPIRGLRARCVVGIVLLRAHFRLKNNGFGNRRSQVGSYRILCLVFVRIPGFLMFHFPIVTNFRPDFNAQTDYSRGLPVLRSNNTEPESVLKERNLYNPRL